MPSFTTIQVPLTIIKEHGVGQLNMLAIPTMYPKADEQKSVVETFQSGGRGDVIVDKKLESLSVGTQLVAKIRVTPGSRTVISYELNERKSKPMTTKGALPKIEKGQILFSPEAKKLFEASWATADREGMDSILILGPSGYGKTSLAKGFAKKMGLEWHRTNCANVRIPEEWWGKRQLREGTGTVFEFEPFVEQLERGRFVWVLDEINRVEQYVSNGLFDALDSGQAYIHSRMIKFGPGIMVVGTMNEGTEYTGTMEIDSALKNRFSGKLQVGPMPETSEVALVAANCSLDETNAYKLVQIMNQLREKARQKKLRYNVSTRTSLQVGHYVSSGMTLREAFGSVLLTIVSPAEGADITDTINSIIGSGAK